MIFMVTALMDFTVMVARMAWFVVMVARMARLIRLAVVVARMARLIRLTVVVARMARLIRLTVVVAWMARLVRFAVVVARMARLVRLRQTSYRMGNGRINGLFRGNERDLAGAGVALHNVVVGAGVQRKGVGKGVAAFVVHHNSESSGADPEMRCRWWSVRRR